MRIRSILTLIALACCLASSAQEKPKELPSSEALTIRTTPLGDSQGGVVTRITFLLKVDEALPVEAPLIVQGSILHQGSVVRNFRISLKPSERNAADLIQTLPPGEVEIEARLLVDSSESQPMLMAKNSVKITTALTGKEFIAEEGDGAEAIIAEGVIPESTGTIRILPPRRDLAPNLFVVEVEARPPVQRVEFFVEGKKIFTKNAPPYRAELDLGSIPKRVEVRVVGYDKSGRYVDADAWVVNERETPLEVKITRTETADGVSHFKLSVQNPKGNRLKSVVLFAGDRKVMEWSRPPYAVDIITTQLAGAQFMRASATDETNYEASDLLFLDGSRYMEEIEVNLIELPVSVVDITGAPIVDLKQSEFTVLEDKKPQKITSFAFSSDLPLSVGMIVDHSGSMLKRIDAARNAAIAFFEQILTPRDRAFFGGFAYDATKISPFVSNVESLKSQVAGMAGAEGGTALYDAIVSGLYKFRTVPGRKALIIVTDGEDTVSRIDYADMLAYVRASRVPIFFIGIGLSPMDFTATSKMKTLAAETGGVAYFVKAVQDLTSTYDQLEKELRSQYLIGYYAESTKKDERYRTVDVQTNRKGAKARTIRGYIP